MPTERITIVVQERGTRIVNRRLRKTSDAATVAARSIQFLRRVLVLFASAVLLRRLFQLVDAFTQLSNRLRIVTSSFSELRAVTEEVLAISNRTRTAFDANAEVFTRVALSAQELGASQAEILQFLERLNQAIIISGASAQEAAAGIIQLTQGIASDRLSGDELRSVLEQLPRVAKVISDSLGVTRGDLRELGEEGKITGQVILDAFKDAGDELREEFDQVAPTIGQSFVVLRNQIIAMIGDFNRLIPIADALAAVILVLAKSLRSLVFVSVVAGTLALAANFTTLVARAGQLIRVMDILILRSFFRFRRSLGLASARMQRLVDLSVRYERIGLLPLTSATRLLARATRGLIALMTGQISLNVALTATATAAKTAVLSLAASVRALTAALASNPITLALVAIIALVFLIVKGVRLLIDLWQRYKNEILVSADGIATLGDLAEAVIVVMKDGLREIIELLEPLKQGLLDIVDTFKNNIQPAITEITGLTSFTIEDILTQFARGIDFVIAVINAVVTTLEKTGPPTRAEFASLAIAIGNVFLGVAEEVLNAFLRVQVGIKNSLRQTLNLFSRDTVLGINTLIEVLNQASVRVGTFLDGIFNAILAGIESVINGAVDALDSLIDTYNRAALLLGKPLLPNLGSVQLGRVQSDPQQIEFLDEDALELQLEQFNRVFLPRIKDVFASAGNTVGQDFQNALTQELSRTGPAEQRIIALFQLAERLAAERLRREANARDERNERLVNEVLGDLQQEIDLLRMTAEEREVSERLLRIQNDLEQKGLDITLEENAEIRRSIELRLEELQLVTEVSRALDVVRGVNIDIAAAQSELNQQVEQGLITTEQATRALLVLQDTIRDSQPTAQTETDDAVEELNREIELLRAVRSERDALDQAQGIADDLRRVGIELTNAETQAIVDQLAPLQQRLELVQATTEALDQIQGSQLNLADVQAELQARIDSGNISVSEAEEAYRRLRIQSLETSRSFVDGFDRGILKLQDDIGDLARSAEEAITGAFKGMEDALVNFVTTGELNFANFANAIIADLARIAIQQAIIGPLLNFLAPGGNLFGGLAGTRALGGPVTGGQPYLVGERGPEIFVPPTAGGSIEPTGNGPSGENIRIVNVVDPAAMGDYLASPEGERIVVNHITRNPNTVRRAAGV